MRKLNGLLILVLTLTLVPTFIVAHAIEFDAERAFDSVVIVIAGDSLGSGFALSENCIVTNAHVVNGFTSVTITSHDGNESKATVYCMDNDADIAVLYTGIKSFPPLSIGNVSEIKVGEDIVVIGAPRGMSYTLTKGTLSSKDRVIRGRSYLQIDAPLNEGNSGGPLLDDMGNVIGMNTMKISDSEGIGLSIPIDIIIAFLEDNGIYISAEGVTVFSDTAAAEEKNEATDSSRKADLENGTTRDETSAINTEAVVMCISLICNVILLLVVFYYRNCCNKLQKKNLEADNFEIELLE